MHDTKLNISVADFGGCSETDEIWQVGSMPGHSLTTNSPNCAFKTWVKLCSLFWKNKFLASNSAFLWLGSCCVNIVKTNGEFSELLVTFFPGIVFIPGTSQLTAKDILYRLQASKAKCIVTSDALAPAVESVMSECHFLKTKLIVAKGSRDGWLNLKELFAWVQLFYQHLCEIKEAVLVRWWLWALGFQNTDELYFFHTSANSL